MARSPRDTLIFATILLSPMAVATAYLAFPPTPEPIVVVREVVVHAPAEPIAAPMVEPPAPEPLDEPEHMRRAGAGLLVHDGQLVLTSEPDVAWARGKLRSIPREDGISVSRAVDPARLPAPLQLLGDARFVLYSPDGSTCTAQTAPDLLRIFGRQDGDVFYAAGDDGVATADELLAARERVFAEAQLLLARLRPATTHTARGPRCDGLWARRADLPAPAVFVAQEIDEGLRARVRARLDEQPAVLALAAEYSSYSDERREYAADIAPWSTWVNNTMQATRWDEIGGTRSFINVVVGDGGEACGDLFTSRTAVLFALADGELLAQPDPGFMHPLALMDLERDGHLEAVTADGTQLESRGPIAPLQSFTFPYHGCPC